MRQQGCRAAGFLLLLSGLVGCAVPPTPTLPSPATATASPALTATPDAAQVESLHVPGWSGLINTVRFDPIDRQARVEIDSIRLLP